MIPGLLVTEGQERGIYIRFKEGVAFWIGRSKETHFSIENDPEVSGRHCFFLQEGASLKLTDESKNGTRVNGRRIFRQTVSLSNTDIIGIGSTSFQVVDVDTTNSTPELHFDLNACLKSIEEHPPQTTENNVAQIGNYLIVDRIGHGANGIVFKALHHETKQLVALKLFSNFMEKAESVHRFLREIRLLSHLKHPSIVVLYESGVFQWEGQNYCFIALEYFQGVNLKSHINVYGAMPWQKVFRVFYQVCTGLVYMHSQGVLHRDVKPHNVLYNDITQVAKIIDLGLGKFVLPGANKNLFTTQSNSVLGTPNFMPLEQWHSSKTVDERADIYSLGVTAYYLLAGRLPFGHNDNLKRLYQAISNYEITPLEELVKPDVPAELLQIIKKSMQLEPENRYANSQELLEALKTLLDHQLLNF